MNSERDVQIGELEMITMENGETKKIWRPSHFLKANGAAKYVLGIGMVPKLYKGRVHILAKTHKVLQPRSED